MSYNHARAVQDVIAEEGFRPSAYQDHLGFWTIGHGICIDSRKGCGIDQAESLYLIDNRLSKIRLQLDGAIPWWREMDDARCSALMNMAYQMGVNGVLRFQKMLDHMEGGDFEKAADEALNSKWADQTPVRAHRISKLIRKGD